MVNEVAKKKHPVPSEQEMAEIFEVEELESRLEMCFWGIGCSTNGCCNGCDAVCPIVNGICGDAACAIP
jgi:hypothetical protein